MGCTSSTEVVTDPITGKSKKKKKLGGAYPGNRRPQNAPYMPPQSEFNKVDGNTAQATAHFVAYGGGNALVLQNQPNQGPASAGPGKQYISVTLPEGVSSGDTIHVQSPDGQLNEIQVPAGMGPGSTFTVEFATGPPPTKTTAPSYNPPMAQASAAQPSSNPDYDDGFATGFGNPNSTPPVATAMPADSYGGGSSYPPPPSYSSAPQPYVPTSHSSAPQPYVPPQR